MLITEELSINGFSKEGSDKIWSKTEIISSSKKVKTVAEILEHDEVKITVKNLDADDKVKNEHSDTFDTALIQRLEINRGMSNPLGYIISQVAQYGQIAKD